MKPVGESRESLEKPKKPKEIEYYVETEFGLINEISEEEFQMMLDFDKLSGIESEIIEKDNKIILMWRD